MPPHFLNYFRFICNYFWSQVKLSWHLNMTLIWDVVYPVWPSGFIYGVMDLGQLWFKQLHFKMPYFVQTSVLKQSPALDSHIWIAIQSLISSYCYFVPIFVLVMISDRCPKKVLPVENGSLLTLVAWKNWSVFDKPFLDVKRSLGWHIT